MSLEGASTHDHSLLCFTLAASYVSSLWLTEGDVSLLGPQYEREELLWLQGVVLWEA